MPYHRLRRLIQGQGGSTLIELLVAMPIAVLLIGVVVQGLGTSLQDQQDLERRSNALTQAQIGLERMTRDVRSAGWVYFRTSGVVDLDAMVRPGAHSQSVHKLVRYDCSSVRCTRYEGPATTYPPPASATFTRSEVVIGRQPGDTSSRYATISGRDVFTPRRIDATTGAAMLDPSSPNQLMVRLRLKVKERRGHRAKPIELSDVVTLRNRTAFSG
jgi:type II secretory pathway pseudopilin PulG